MEIDQVKEERSGRSAKGEEEKWVCDSSVDHRGRVPLRAFTGVWKASLFIIAIEFVERMCYFGIATNLITYLTKVLHQDLKNAAKNVNYWAGVTAVMPLIGGFLADAYMGRFKTVLVSSFIYLLGLSILTMSQLVPSLRPCDTETCTSSSKLHQVFFFVAMYLISAGTGGHKPSLESFGADQFDEDHPEERKKKMSYFNWWSFGLCCGIFVGVTVVVYIQDFVSWADAYILLSCLMAVAIFIFLGGRSFYRYRVPRGSPLTPMAQVLVAAMAKRNLPHPLNPAHLYEAPTSERREGRLLRHTSKLRFLDKAAIIEHTQLSAEKQSPWSLATVTKVEEMKLLLNMFPIWLASLVLGICNAQSGTFFIKQGSAMNRHLAHNFTMPPASVFSFSAIFLLITISAYDKILVPLLRRLTGNERGITILQRIGVGMAISVASMICAALVERKRLSSDGGVRAGAGAGVQPTMSVFWLAPQFMILGIGDGFALVGLQEYFYDQVPDSMRSLGIAFYLSVGGASNFLSSLLITAVDHVTEKGERGSWFAKDLNNSRLDNFYWLLALMSALNFCAYLFLANRYSYKAVDKRVADADSYDPHGVTSIP